MRLYFRVARHVGVVVIALLSLGLSTPTTATENGNNAAGCLALVAGPTGQFAASLAKGDSVVEKGSKAFDTAALYGSKNCAAYSQDYVYLALTSALTALVAGKQLPNDYGDAQKVINGFLAQIVADIVAAALSDGSPLAPLVSALPAGWLEALKKAIAEGATKEIETLLTEARNSNPLFDQFLNYFDCGLIVATGGAADQVLEAVENFEGCGAFLMTCVGSLSDCITGIADLGAAIAKGIANLPAQILDGIVKGFNAVADALKGFGGSAVDAVEDFHCKFAGKCLAPGPQQPQENYVTACVPGWFPGWWVSEPSGWGADYQWVAYWKPPNCECLAEAKLVGNGHGAFKCVCDDKTLGYLGGSCGACPDGQTVIVDSGACGVCPQPPIFSTQMTTTGPASHVKTSVVGEDGRCYPQTCRCAKGDKPVVDPVTGQCQCESVCQPGYRYPEKTAELTNAALCEICPANTKGYHGQTNYTHFDPASYSYDDWCTSCKTGEQSEAGSTSCERICKVGTVFAPAPLSVSGKGGQKSGGKQKGAQFAALGSDVTNPLCKTCAADHYPSYHDGPAGSCKKCAFGTTAKPGQAECTEVVCTGNTRLDPVGGHKCVPCKGGAGGCVEGPPVAVGKPRAPKLLPEETIPAGRLEIKPNPVDEAVTMPARLQPGERVKGSTAKTAPTTGGGSAAKTRTKSATGTPALVSSPSGTPARVKQQTGTPAFVSSPSGTSTRAKQLSTTPATVKPPTVTPIRVQPPPTLTLPPSATTAPRR